MRKTKILATLGPVSSNEAMFTQLVRAGVDGVRLSFSHGTQDQHRAEAAMVRKVAAQEGRQIAMLADLCGPKIRVGKFVEGQINLEVGQTFTLTSEDVPGTNDRASMSYPLANDLKKGDIMLLDDGLLRLRVTAISPPAVETIVEVGGPLSNNKGINVPSAKLQVAAVTEKDRSDIEVAKEIGVDYIALSFVQSVYDVLQCKSLAGKIPVIAKLEKPDAIRFLPDIVEAADGVMVARGDLGVEMGAEKVPLAQKQAILLTNKAGKLVITATQMLDSMIRNPRPTRAEANDVANAILDGTDVLMLSGETAVGRYPVEAVQMMDVIAREVEGSSIYLSLPESESLGGPWTLPNACARAAASISRSVKLVAIAVVTHRGRTVDLLSDYRPHAPILTITDNPITASRLALCWGAIPVLGPGPALTPDEASDRAEMLARTMLNAKTGDTLAIVVGSAQDTGEKSLNLRTLKDK